MSHRRWTLGYIMVGMVVLVACSSTPQPVKQPTLNAPTIASPAVRAAISEGNRLFASGRYQAAKIQYEKAILAKKTVAEAHYNLALALDYMGKRDEARPHYMEAANLAPGHQVIWNSPVLRRYGDVKVEKNAGGMMPGIPGIGGGGGGGGIMGGGGSTGGGGRAGGF